MSSIDAKPLIVRNHTGVLRAATELDASAVLDFRRLTAGETDFLSREPDEICTTIDEQAEFLRKQLHAPEHLFLVADLNCQVVGVVDLTGSDLRRLAHGATLGISVVREFWNCGIGKALMLAALNWADGRGLTRVSLEVVATNGKAIRLYESMGFIEEGRLRSQHNQGGVYVDSLMMSRVRV